MLMFLSINNHTGKTNVRYEVGDLSGSNWPSTARS